MSLNDLPSLMVRWLAEPTRSAAERTAIATAWRMCDPGNYSAMESNPTVPPDVRLLMKQVRP